MLNVLMLTLLASAAPEPPAFFSGNEELRSYLLEAGENNPELRARYAAWQAALERIPQANALEDPVLTYGQFLQSENLRAKVMLSQRFPWFGTLRARGDRAAAEAEAALSAMYGARDKVFERVKQAYFDYGWLAERIRVTESQAALLEQMEEVVRGKLALGMAKQEDLLRVSIEKTTLEDRYQQLLGMRGPLSAALNETLGCAVCEERPWPQPAEFPPQPPPAPVVLAQVRVANPELEQFDHLRDSRERMVALARKEGLPDISLGLEYTAVSKPRQIRPDRPYPASLNAANRLARVLTGANPFSSVTAAIDAYSLAASDEPMAYSDGGEDNLMFSVSLTLPVWRKRVKAGVREAELLVDEIEHNKQRRQLQLDTEARTALYELEDARRRHALYKDSLLPQATQSYESLQGRYASGTAQANFLDVLESIKVVLDFELAKARTARDWHVAGAALERLMGGPWSARAEAAQPQFEQGQAAAESGDEAAP